MLGRVTALSYLGSTRASAAIARHLIALGHWYVGDAHYWLAFDEYHLNEQASALADAQTAKVLLLQPRAYTLAGLIRMKQKTWPEAKQEFLAALKAQPDNCDVLFYLGTVDGELEVWPEAAEYFGRSVACFQDSQRSLERKIADLEQKNDAWDVGLLARHRRDLRETIAHKASALYNAALSYATAGDRRRAMTYATQAGAFPAYADRVKVLVARLGRHQRWR